MPLTRSPGCRTSCSRLAEPRRRASRTGARRRGLRRLVAITAIGVGGLSLSACTAEGSGDVVVGFYPLEYLAGSIAGDSQTVLNLAQPGAEPHDMELTAKQIGAVGAASLVIYEKGLQPALDDAVRNEHPAHVLDVSTVTPLEGGYEELGHGDAESHEGHDHEQETLDPHIWLDPKRMLALAAAVKDHLVQIDEAGASTYEQNLAALQTKLENLDADFTAGLANCERTAIVTTHNAFGYLAKAYGLQQVGIAGLTEEEPSPQKLDEVQQFVQANGVTTIFYEQAVSDKYAKTVAAETGAKTAVLNTLEVRPPSGDYLSAMEQNLQALRQALGCS
ncbi:metal ABC transporter substrate-binding protein [Cumulibacter manganitolerans]|uniref:metal ABC transporter substrate-binding protein n=1 Tax=Cumulibacter manganitolerans TaxID=1884992 RepID=UPI0012956C32|nr:metal ABC transporter substrate-binding protein [Cumulibacter manganitolerans]